MSRQSKKNISVLFKELEVNQSLTEEGGDGMVYHLRNYIVRFQHKTGRKFTTVTIKDDPDLYMSSVVGVVITRTK